MLPGHRGNGGHEVGKPEKHYTYMVTVTFDMQFTFAEDEVEPTDGGDTGDFDPTEDALRALEKELEECIGNCCSVSKIEAYADCDSLLGVDED